MVLRSWDKHRDVGLLILRIGIGIMFMMHGWPKLMGGLEKWAKLGGALDVFGIGFAPAFWGFMAARSEFGGGLVWVLGFLTRPACFFLLMTMIVATATHLGRGDSFGRYSHALEAAVLFLSLLFIGPGKYSVDDKMSPSSNNL